MSAPFRTIRGLLPGSSGLGCGPGLSRAWGWLRLCWAGVGYQLVPVATAATALAMRVWPGVLLVTEPLGCG